MQSWHAGAICQSEILFTYCPVPSPRDGSVGEVSLCFFLSLLCSSCSFRIMFRISSLFVFILGGGNQFAKFIGIYQEGKSAFWPSISQSTACVIREVQGEMWTYPGGAPGVESQVDFTHNLNFLLSLLACLPPSFLSSKFQIWFCYYPLLIDVWLFTF